LGRRSVERRASRRGEREKGRKGEREKGRRGEEERERWLPQLPLYLWPQFIESFRQIASICIY
jgi:hypothetical protein